MLFDWLRLRRVWLLMMMVVVGALKDDAGDGDQNGGTTQTFPIIPKTGYRVWIYSCCCCCCGGSKGKKIKLRPCFFPPLFVGAGVKRIGSGLPVVKNIIKSRL